MAKIPKAGNFSAIATKMCEHWPTTLQDGYLKPPPPHDKEAMHSCETASKTRLHYKLQEGDVVMVPNRSYTAFINEVHYDEQEDKVVLVTSPFTIIQDGDGL